MPQSSGGAHSVCEITAAARPSKRTPFSASSVKEAANARTDEGYAEELEFIAEILQGAFDPPKQILCTGTQESANQREHAHVRVRVLLLRTQESANQRDGTYQWDCPAASTGRAR